MLERRRKETVDDRTRIEVEMRGYRKALSLYEDSSSEEGMGRPASRLLLRIDRRIGEAAERSIEEDFLSRAIQDVETELRSVEKQLVDELQACVAVASSHQAMNAAIVRRNAVEQGKTLPAHDEAMWSPTPVLAYRVWGLRSDGFYGAWKRWAESTSRARCKSGVGAPLTDGGCSDVAFGCGIYAAKDAGQLLRSVGVTLNQDFAAGLVALEGKVIEHERGYRAETARVLSLVIVHDGVMTIVDGEAEVQEAFTDPWERGAETGFQPAVNDDGCMRRTITSELKKREEGYDTWI